MKTVKFLTLGCKVNQYDTQLIREQLLGSGLREIHNGDSADVYVVNTCTVTGHADADSLNLIRRAARQNPRAKIVVTGCLTELDENKIRPIKGVSIIAKNRDKGKIAGLLHCGDKQAVKKEGISHFQGRTRAFLKIQDGCDNFCSYCKVPFVRGRSRSRLPQDIV
ncbi:MAG: tRNA (N(6)-L-threonylcarbamoyladenosine(37)-C(2))-methylthiotransferase MtaB, partial [Deltaproteobacteria bacterium]